MIDVERLKERVRPFQFADRIAKDQRGKIATMLLLGNYDKRSLAHFTFWLSEAVDGGYLDPNDETLKAGDLVAAMLRCKLAEYEKRGF